MPWFKVDDGFHGHPKVVELTLEAVGAWALAGSWCAAYLTDGEIGIRSLQRLGGGKEQAVELVNSGLWLESEPGLYQFKDWDDYQPLKETVEAEREAARDRMQKVRAKKKGTGSEDVQPNVQANNTGTFGGSSEEVRVTPSHPIPSHPLTTCPPADAADEFDQWYARYPKKEAKENARKAFTKARKSASLEVLLEGLERYAVSVKGKERQFIALPGSWLNAGRWQDEIPTTTKPAASSPWNQEFYK